MFTNYDEPYSNMLFVFSGDLWIIDLLNDPFRRHSFPAKI